MLFKVIAAVLLLAEDNGEAVSGPFEWSLGIPSDAVDRPIDLVTSRTFPDTGIALIDSFFGKTKSEDVADGKSSSNAHFIPTFIEKLEESAVGLFNKVFTENSKQKNPSNKKRIPSGSITTLSNVSDAKDNPVSLLPVSILEPISELSSALEANVTQKPSQPPTVDELTVKSDNATASNVTAEG